MPMQMRQQRETFRKREVKPVIYNSADYIDYIDLGCARTQITYKHQDETF